MFEKIDGQSPETFPTNTIENQSELSPTEQDQASSTKPTELGRIEQPSNRKSGGPRTPVGKQRSKYNARKHGICSNVTLLPGESAVDFQSLRRDFWKSLQPVGEFEEFLVDKLVTIAWRYRRMLVPFSGCARMTESTWKHCEIYIGARQKPSHLRGILVAKRSVVARISRKFQVSRNTANSLADYSTEWPR